MSIKPETTMLDAHDGMVRIRQGKNVLEASEIRVTRLPAPTTQPAAKPAENAKLQKKLISWVEKFFSQNYRDVKNRETIEWGQPK